MNKYIAIRRADSTVAGIVESSSPPQGDSTFSYIAALPGVPDPAMGMVFQGGGFIETEESLEIARSQRWEQAKVLRQLVMDGGATTTYGVVDSDPLSLTKISQTTLVAMTAEEGYEVTWTLKDNSQVTLSVRDFLDMSSQVFAHINRVHERFARARQKLNEATTLEEINAVDFLQEKENE